MQFVTECTFNLLEFTNWRCRFYWVIAKCVANKNCRFSYWRVRFFCFVIAIFLGSNRTVWWTRRFSSTIFRVSLKKKLGQLQKFQKRELCSGHALSEKYPNTEIFLIFIFRYMASLKKLFFDIFNAISDVFKVTLTDLIHFFPIYPFSTPWKHQNTVRFFDILRA